MAGTNDGLRRWRSKFAGVKIQFAPDAPPNADAKAALNYGIAGAAATIIALVLALAGIWWLKWIALVVWLIGLPFIIKAVFAGKFEGDVIAAGHAPAKGKPYAMGGMLLGLGSAALAVLCLLFLLVMAILPAPSLPGKYGDAQKTFDEYMKAIRDDDFTAYFNCLDDTQREGKDTTVEGTEEDQRNAYMENMRKAFEAIRKRRIPQEIAVIETQYSDGGTTARDARRADLRIRTLDKATRFATELGMSMTREADGWKVTSSEL
jgi:hypothetical protein